MSIQSPAGTLDIKNATLRVGKLEVSNIQGVDTALNVTRANSVLIYDDQVSTTTFNGFTSSVGVRDTGNGYLDLAGGYVYWGQKLPNSWVIDFEMDIRSGTNGGPLYANVFSTTNTGGDGYSFTFNDSNDKISLYYDSTLLTETTVSGLFTASEDWQKVVINYERGLIAISLDGSRKFYYKDIERETPYVNGEYISFSSASTDGRKIRDLRIVNGEKWVYSGESNLVYTQGSVGIGVTDPTVALDVSGTVKATVFDGDGSAITNISSANVGDFASNVVRIENLETSNGHIWSNLASNVTTLRDEIDSNLATARTDLQSNVTILRDEIDSNLATARTDLQSNVTILRGEIDSNLATARADLQSNVTILRDEIDSNLATARTDLQSNVTILRGEIDSNLATARADLQSNVTILRDTAITFTGTKTFQDDVVLESNLRVQGDLLVANTVNMTVSDPILELGSNNQNTGDVGLVMTRHGASNSNVAIFFDETADTLKLGYTLNGAGDSTLEFDSNALAVSVQGALTASTGTFSGDVGIGTTAPGYTLDVDGDINFTGTFYQGGSPFVSSLWTDGQDSLYYRSNVEVGTANLFVDTTTSRVGINTITPGYDLDVDGDINFTGNFYQGGSPFVSSEWTTGSESLYYRSNVEVGTANLFVDTTTSRVGINTITPGYDLDVDGDINFTGNFYQGGSPFVSSEWTTGSESLYYRSNVEVGTANLFVDTTTSRVGINTITPGYDLDVHGTSNVGALTATSVSGNGSGLTSLNATNISSGTINKDRLPGTLNNTTIGSLAIGANDVTLTAKANYHGLKILKAFDSPDEPATLLLSGDGDVFDDIAFEIRGNTIGSSVDTTTTRNSDDTTFGILHTGHTYIGYANLNPGEVGGNSQSGDPMLNVNGAGAFTGDFEVGTANLFVDVSTSNVGIGTTSPAYKLDVHGTSNVGALTTTSVSGNGSGLTSLNASNISSGTINKNRLPGTLNDTTFGSITLTSSSGLYVDGDYLAYKPVEGGSSISRNFVKFIKTNNASYPFYTNRTPSGDVVIGSGTTAAGGEIERMRFKGGDGTRDIEVSNANLVVSGNITGGTIDAAKISNGTLADSTGGVKAIYFTNTEQSGYYTDKAGILAFDENFYDDTEYGTGTYDPDATFVGGNGGGLLIKNEDGWGAIFTSQNTRWAKGYWDTLNVTNTVTASTFSGSGSGLTSLNASNLTSGTVSSDRLSLAASDIPDLSASKITTGTLTRPIDTTTGTFSGRVDSDRYLTSNTFPLPDPNQHSFRHVCMITNSSVPYGLTQAGGCIYEYNPSTGDTVRVVEPVSEPTAGTFTTTAGREYFPMGSPMAIVGEHKMAPFTNLGSLFGFVENRNDPTTAYLYAPYSNVSVEYFHDTSVTGTPTSTIAVPYKTVVSFTCTSASGTNSHIFVVKGGRILMSSTGNGGGDTRVLAPLSTIAYGYYNTSFKKDIYLQNDVTTSGKCVYSNQNVPLILSQAGDGDGGDGTCGIPFELVADTYIVPHDIRGWMIQFLYTETVVNVAYWSATNSQWEQYGTYSPSGTPSILSPEQLQVGKMSLTGTDIGTSHTLWMFTGTKDFTLTVEEYTDLERTVSGFRRHQVAQQIQTNLLDNVVQDSNGNVGIGTENPGQALHIYRSGANNAVIKAEAAGTQEAEIQLYHTGDAAAWSMYMPANSDSLRFYRNGDKMTLTSGGNVGIGTTSPGQKLEVGHYGGALSSDFGAIRITNHATNLHATSLARFDISLGDIASGTGSGKRKLIFNSKTTTTDSGTDILCLDGESNNVGIGTASPGYKLDVNGTVNTGALTATSVSGNGSGLTSLNAGNLASGTVPSARLSLAASDIPSLDASKITTGTLGRPISTSTGVFTSTGNAVLVGTNGKLGLTINDGDGNCNLTFNHASVVPDQNGSSGRIDCGVDGTTGYMRLRVKSSVTGGTSTGNLPECVRIEEGYVRAYSNFYVDDNVGIGTTSPIYKLDVRGDVYVDNSSVFMSGYSEGPTNNTVYSQYIGKRYSTRILAGMEIENVRTNSAGTAITTTGHYGQKLHFRAHDYGIYGGNVGDRTMTIVGSNVGIGTASPQDTLHVYGAPFIQHDTRRSLGTAAWYKIGTWDAAGSDGARLKISLLGAVSYNSAGRARGGETIIYASINNDNNASSANIDGLVESHGKLVTNQVKFKQVGTDRTKYEIHARILTFTQHSMSVECSGTTTFTKEWVASSDPGAESATVSHAIFSTVVDNSGNVGIGTTSPGYALTIRKNTNTLLLESENAGVQSNVNIDFKNYDAQDPPGARITARDDGVYGSHLFFSTRTGNGSSLSEKLRIASNGNVGVGTTTPHAKLHVNGGAGGISSALRVYFKYNDYNSSYISLQLNNGGWGPMSIYASDDIVTAAYIVSHSGTIGASDTRIKKNIVDANDAECLETLRLLKPKKYQYKDEVDRGTEPVWGFIAQEVRETLPYATELRRDVLPNIYELANVSQSNVITFTNFNTSNLESNATTLIRTKGIDGEDHDIHLAEVIDDHTIRVEEDLSEWTGSVDETGNVITEITTTTITPEEYNALEDTSGYIANITGYQNANVVISVEEYNALEDTAGYEEIIDNYTKTTTTYPGTQLFVYGQEVDDFIFLKKDAIWTVATAALQEVDRQLQAEKARNDALEARIAALENA